ncbi:MAG TPA: hypothetical protein VF128_02075 [Gemmatimonadaceae bacterium]
MSKRASVIACAFILAACTREEVAQEPESPRADSTIVLVMVDSGAPKLLPRDEANESFRQFRSDALRAFASRDTTFLYGMLAPEIRNSFGGDDSVAGFRRLWKTDEPTSDVWTALIRVLTMGGQQSSDSQFTAPYVYAFWPDSIDAFEHVAVVGDSVRVHDAPAAGSRILGGALHSILKFREWRGLPASGVAADTTWAKVLLPNADSGWIRGASVYSPVGWRAMFVRRGGRWLMVFFVRGD